MRPIARRRAQTPLRALDRGELEIGRRALLQSLKYESDSFETMVDIAAELAFAGFVADAEHVLRRAQERFPHRVEAKVELVRLFLASGNDEKALRLATQGLRDHHRNSDLHALAACANEQLGLYEEAANHWAAILADGSRSFLCEPPARRVARAAGDAAGAIDCLRRVVGATSGQDLDAITSLGITLSADGQHDEAIGLLTHVARSQPDLGGPQADLANALLAAGRIEDAITRFSEVAAPGPGFGAGVLRPRTRLSKDRALARGGRGLSNRPSSSRPIRPSAPTISGWRCPRSANPTTRARRCCARPRSSPTTPAFARRCSRCSSAAAAADAPAPAAPVPRFGGDIRTFALPEVLEFLRLQNKTGSLVVSSRRGAAIVRLVHGQVTSASAPGVKPPGRDADRARNHHRRSAGDRPGAAAPGRRRERAKRSARCCCASTPRIARR